jgi:iron complex transport system substrate-binding protein
MSAAGPPKSAQLHAASGGVWAHTRVAAHRWAFAAALLAAGLPSARGSVEAVDDAGVTVTLAAPALRIVSLAPHATELLYAAGAGDRLVGVLATSDWPPEALAKPRVGDSRALDLERILLLAPDLVVTWPFAAPARSARRRWAGE